MLSVAVVAATIVAGKGVQALTSPAAALERARDYLLPGAWATFNGTGLEGYVRVIPEGLLVSAGLEGKEHDLAFLIRSEHVLAGRHVSIFLESIGVLKMLSLNAHAHELEKLAAERLSWGHNSLGGQPLAEYLARVAR